jgi:hypothetical protein
MIRHANHFGCDKGTRTFGAGGKGLNHVSIARHKDFKIRIFGKGCCDAIKDNAGFDIPSHGIDTNTGHDYSHPRLIAT